MIKLSMQHFFDVDIPMIYCDWCGEGIELKDDNNADTKEFVVVHYECTKPKNDNLGFLDKAEPLV